MDTVMTLLEGFEERFERHGHRPSIVVLQPGVSGSSILKCDWCEEQATIHVRNEHGGWYMPETSLDLACPFPTTEHDEDSTT